MISEAIEHDLKELHCPTPVAAYQIQGLDMHNLKLAIQWLVATSLKSRSKPNPTSGGLSRLEFSKFGKAIEVLELKSGLEIPTPHKNEIVVRVTATPIHPSILGLIKGRILIRVKVSFVTVPTLSYLGTYGHKPTLPAVPGNEGKVLIRFIQLLNKET